MNKKKIFLTGVAATLIFASCSRESEDFKSGNCVEKARLEIGITEPWTRAIANAANPIPGDQVQNFKVFVVDDDGSLKTAFSNDGTPLVGSKAVEVNTRARHIYVIANAGDIAIANESGIKNYLADLNGAGKQDAAAFGRWATGEEALLSSDFQQNGNEWRASKTIALKFIAARITVKVETREGSLMKTHYDAAANDGSLVLNSVAIINGRSQSKLFGSSLIPAAYSIKKYYEGMGNDDFDYYPTGDHLMAEALLSDNIPAGDFSKTYYYYVFENDAITAATFPTVIIVKGTYENKPVYFPVHIAPYEQFMSGNLPEGNIPILRGHSYDITINLSGDPRFSTGGSYPGATGGIDDPTNPVVSGKVEISIRTPEWIPVSFDKEF